ncbi:hypothetical protein Poli38472_004842 [Pythium oligandrum]|uniref:NADH:flavin oxidoreductase/NADH oxidase N-terminal domain-containing protein n=1 Tax=Pythium oligandrum TaxID=41045 RepID=A0A8K1CCE3_PYTOL|nr:hypothetical protein Poli38472_004841 [Pythium oligandrum]TMW59773.1 hypothetical protein Poli38472_004842 [Pythium oligandrum]|eukprot:TMW59772.1 hypothetical protein Poli38472_004841 [Pythium oligandrum]
MVTTGYKLFTPLTLAKDLTLKNRVVVSPMTRARADKQTRVPNADNVLYYEQRAGAGLIITEATAVSEQGFGWFGAPGLYTQAHADGWKKVVDAVHAKNGKIFLQLWHMGRQSHSSFNPKNEVVAPSAIGISQGQIRDAKGEHATYQVPRALETDEIPAIIEDYRKSAELAKQVGFDGVEVHGANGYLVDTFLQSSTNKRTDKYGGSIENRARFLLELVDALKTVYPSDRVAVRLSPNGAYAEMGSQDNYDTFTYVFQQLSQHNLAYLAVLDGFGFGYHDKDRLVTTFDAKTHFKGHVFATNSYTRDTAEGVVRSGAADAVGFGRLYISNPDLAERFENDWPLNADASYADYWDANQGSNGYTTYPAYAAPEQK